MDYHMFHHRWQAGKSIVLITFYPLAGNEQFNELAPLLGRVAHRPTTLFLNFNTKKAMENNLLFNQPRKSEMDINSIYFWTDTIKDWKNLLQKDKYKIIIINTLKELSEKNLVCVYGFAPIKSGCQSPSPNMGTKKPEWQRKTERQLQ
jgi:hypothetical protein